MLASSRGRKISWRRRSFLWHFSCRRRSAVTPVRQRRRWFLPSPAGNFFGGEMLLWSSARHLYFAAAPAERPPRLVGVTVTGLGYLPLMVTLPPLVA